MVLRPVLDDLTRLAAEVGDALAEAEPPAAR
jgi:hypothetical protein